jgi:hypothetical protein
MHRRTIMHAILATSVLTALTAPVAAQSARDLVGTWTIVSAGDAYGPNAKGNATFDSNGRFSIILMRNALPKYSSNNRVQGTPAEYKATVEGSLAYFGSYSLNGTDLNLHIEGSTFPNWTGGDQKRTNVSVTGDEFKYTQPNPSSGGAPAELIWKRVK